MFKIDILSKYWINGDDDDPNDVCLHGDVKAYIGDEVFECSCTISAMGLRLLKTLTEDHVIPNNEEQMMPCCGHFIIPNEELDNVIITGCAYGVDWKAYHESGNIKIVTESGRETYIDKPDYQKEVFRICDEIEMYFKQCAPKIVPEDIFEKNGYIAFWNEWHRRRKQEFL